MAITGIGAQQQICEAITDGAQLDTMDGDAAPRDVAMALRGVVRVGCTYSFASVVDGADQRLLTAYDLYPTSSLPDLPRPAPTPIYWTDYRWLWPPSDSLAGKAVVLPWAWKVLQAPLAEAVTMLLPAWTAIAELGAVDQPDPNTWALPQSVLDRLQAEVPW